MKDCLGEETCLVKITGGLKLSKLLGPVIQSVVSLMSSLVVKMLTVLVSTVSNSQVFLLEKNVSSFCKCKSYTHFFSKNIIIYAIFNDQCFNDTLTNNIVSFEQLGSVHVLICKCWWITHKLNKGFVLGLWIIHLRLYFINPCPAE